MPVMLHDIEWTDERVARFWDFYNGYPAFQNKWFAAMVGDGLVRYACRHAQISGSVLDYGTGKGHLIPYLFQESRARVSACDFTPSSVEYVNNCFKDNPRYAGGAVIKGFPLAYAAGSFDVVFFIEAIEHMTDAYLVPTLEEIRRLLRPGGTVIVSTPNEEELAAGKTMCPECGALFHMVQHTRRFDEGTLKGLMENHGFLTTRCEALDIEDHNRVRSVRKLARCLVHILTRPKPHLIYIGKSRERQHSYLTSEIRQVDEDDREQQEHENADLPHRGTETRLFGKHAHRCGTTNTPTVV